MLLLITQRFRLLFLYIEIIIWIPLGSDSTTITIRLYFLFEQSFFFLFDTNWRAIFNWANLIFTMPAKITYKIEGIIRTFSFFMNAYVALRFYIFMLFWYSVKFITQNYLILKKFMKILAATNALFLFLWFFFILKQILSVIFRFRKFI